MIPPEDVLSTSPPITSASRLRAHTRRRLTAELHDVMAHELAGLSIQARVAQNVLGDDPERAAEILAAVQRAAADALADARRLVRLDPVTPMRDAVPRIATIHALSDAHPRLVVHEEGDSLDLPAAVGLTAYRVVEDTLAHLGDLDVAVLVRRGTRRLDILTTWTSSSRPPDLADLALVLRERAALFGGSVECDPRGSIAVHLPLDLA